MEPDIKLLMVGGSKTEEIAKIEDTPKVYGLCYSADQKYKCSGSCRKVIKPNDAPKIR